MNTIFLESFAIRVQIVERKPHTHHNENHQTIKGVVFLFISNRNPRAPSISPGALAAQTIVSAPMFSRRKKRIWNPGFFA